MANISVVKIELFLLTKSPTNVGLAYLNDNIINQTLTKPLSTKSLRQL